MKKIKAFKKIMKILTEIDLTTLKPNISLSDIIKMDTNKKEYLNGQGYYLNGQGFALSIFLGLLITPILTLSLGAIFGLSLVYSFLISFSLILWVYFSPPIFICFKNLFLFNKLLDKKVREYDKLEMYKEILDKINKDTLIDNLENIVIVAFLNNIGFEIQEYVDNRINNEFYSDILFKNKYLLEVYLKNLSGEEKIDFYNNKENYEKLNKYLSDIDLLNFKRLHILSAAENYVINNGKDKDRAVYTILKDLNGDAGYIDILKKRLGVIDEKNDLLDQLNRNIKHVVF